MHNLIESLTPLQDRISEKSAYLGVVVGLTAFGFSLFLPWASIPTGISAQDGGSSSGWSELAFLAALPFVGLLLSIFGFRRPISPKAVIVSSIAALILLGVNNVLDRSSWGRRPVTYRLEGIVFAPSANYGSTLDIGFWMGLAGLMALSIFGLAWSLHKAHPISIVEKKTQASSI